MVGIADKVLQEIADEIGDNEKLSKLGLQLGYTGQQTSHYLKENRESGRVTSKGTFNMLAQWAKATKAADKQTILYGALEESGLVAIAEKHLQPPSK